MGSIFFDIPFRTRSTDSDFNCKDGEISYADNIGGGNFPTSSDPGTGTREAPTPAVSFALVRDTLPGWHIHPDVYPSKTIAASDPSMEYWSSMGAQLLNLFQTEATRQNLFVAPFYVMAAWKTIDGYYLSPSTPVMMIPNSDVPPVATDADINKQELEFKIAGAVCSLRIKMTAPEELRDWVGKIKTLDIFVSQPVHSYETFRSFIPQHRLTTDAWCRSLDLSTGETADRRICTDILPLAWKAAITLETGTLSNLFFHPFHSIELGRVDLFEDWTKCPENTGREQMPAGQDGRFRYADILDSAADARKSSPAVIEGAGKEIDVETRPLKLSGAGELKKVRFIRLRGNYDPAALTMSVYASRDMLRWWCVARKKGGSVVALPPAPFRFHKLRIEGKLEKGSNLQGLSIEYL